jgi:hypothetical protein
LETAIELTTANFRECVFHDAFKGFNREDVNALVLAEGDITPGFEAGTERGRYS